ncbi:AraC family transcriptional regulator [Fundidesulfovibrio agrisoli]|uniref:AraC family transcriptional regulator n=1 Tax=Fundidesulfovibrio agrisoli TaxID=2922717 RepID=UPI001FAC39A5|nr:helix-turn-helix transcriptional regulator [Fundidesulfovibrio agrisoli]
MSPNGQIFTERELPALVHLPRPVFVRLEILPAGSRTRVHSHPWGQFTYASKGVLEVSTATGSHVAPPDRAVWIPPDTRHSVTNSSEAEMRSLYVDASAVAEPFLGKCKVLEVTPLMRELLQAVSRIPAEYPGEGPEARLVAVLLDQMEGLPEVDFSLPFPSDERLRKVCQALKDHPDDKRTRAQLAHEAGISDKTLIRLFQRETGLSFRDWRQRLRLLLSLTALAGGQSVTAVALDAGYESTSAFIAAFRKRFGRTPGEFFQRADS